MAMASSPICADLRWVTTKVYKNIQKEHDLKPNFIALDSSPTKKPQDENRRCKFQSRREAILTRGIDEHNDKLMVNVRTKCPIGK